MSQFLRDERFKNLSINENAIVEINNEFIQIANKINEETKSNNKEIPKEKFMFVHYIIRFDNKGFRVFDFNKLMKYVNDAHKIERIIFVLDSIESADRIIGKNIELRLDSLNAQNCYLEVQDDNNDWVDLVFNQLKERIYRYRNNNYLARNRFIQFVVQMLGITILLFFSFWVARNISPKLTIDNAFAFTFIITIILLSNVWTLLYDFIFMIIDYFWPNIAFKEKGDLHWLIKALLSTLFVGFFLSLFHKLLSYIFVSMSSIIK